MDESTEVAVKLGLSIVAAAVVLLRHRAPGRLGAEQAGPALVFVAFLSVLAYFNFRTYHGSSFLHRHEHFHYFLSSKYFPELGYDGLYVASIAAERVDHPVTQRFIQDLRMNEIVPIERVEAHLQEVVTRFRPDRWQRFIQDHRYFTAASGKEYFEGIRVDHGFNATPAWAFVGQLFDRWLPATDRNLHALASLDTLLLVLAFVAVFSTYGARTACLCIIVFGLNYPSRFSWIGGGFLRQDWLAASVIGVCCLKRGWPAAAGALFGYAAIVRLFPAVFLLGPVVLIARSLYRRSDTRWARHLAGGFAAAIALGVLAGSLAGRGFAGWIEFASDILLHERTWVTNSVGLPQLLAYDAPTLTRQYVDASLPDPWRVWEAAMQRSRDAAAGIISLSQAAFVLLTVAAAWSLPLDAAAGAGMAVIFALAMSACYYWGMLALVPLHGLGWPATIGWLVLNAGLYGVHLVYESNEVRYAAVSVALAVFFTAWLGPAALRPWIRRRSPV